MGFRLNGQDSGGTGSIILVIILLAVAAWLFA